ncbi:MAG: glycosyltransferase [bacterium]|nr:glycosyltransferase [bacterium]
MTIAILSICESGTGNTTSARRVGRHLEAAGHTIRYICLRESTEEVMHDLENAHSDLIIGFHAYGSGKHLLHTQIPYVIIFGGTDINELPKDAEKLHVMTHVVQSAQQCIAYSEAVEAKAKTLWPNITNKLSIIEQGVAVQPSSFSLRQALSLETTDILFLLPAGLRDVKDPLYLIEEVQKWRDEDAHINLVIIGVKRDPLYAEKVQSIANASQCIHLLDVIAQEDLHAAMQDASIVLNTSKSEGCCNTILEAMALGTPVMARAIPGNIAIVEHEITGLVFDAPEQWREQAEKLISNTTLQESLSQNALQYMKEHHDPGVERKKYQKLLHTINMPL